MVGNREFPPLPPRTPWCGPGSRGGAQWPCAAASTAWSRTGGYRWKPTPTCVTTGAARWEGGGDVAGDPGEERGAMAEAETVSLCVSCRSPTR